MFDFHGQKALVTGASGAIGGAIARMFHSAGAEVVVSGTNESKLNALVTGLGSRCHAVVADLGEDADCERLVSEAINLLGGLDVLVCNAGITSDMLAVRMPTAEFDKVIRLNLHAPFILNKLAASHMMRQKRGRIINISSITAFIGNPGQANYTAAKSGMVGMTKTLALELASRNVTVNCIAPGFITTPMTDKLNDAQKEAMLARIPSKKFGTPEDVAYTAGFLSSAGAEYITGQTIHVNGGMYTS